MFEDVEREYHSLSRREVRPSRAVRGLSAVLTIDGEFITATGVRSF
jgi:hypothetical protein